MPNESNCPERYLHQTINISFKIVTANNDTADNDIATVQLEYSSGRTDRDIAKFMRRTKWLHDDANLPQHNPFISLPFKSIPAR